MVQSRPFPHLNRIAMRRLAVVLSAVLSVSSAEDLTFPPGFKFGAATAAFQVEGAWNVSDKGESVWDRFSHADPRRITDGSNADVACDSYHLWRRDIEMAEELGLHFYRFSISWSRLLPNGFANHISEDGKNYYNDLIDGLLEKGIQPFVTIYHVDLPQLLEDLGGWTNPLIADWFEDYARVVFTLFGDRVKWWLTINEPLILCDGAYNTGILAPGFISPDVGAFLCSKYSLLAHAKAWRLYDEEFKAKYHGKVSIANQLVWFQPSTEADAEVAELVRQNCVCYHQVINHLSFPQNGKYAHPIYSKQGGWPPTVEKVLMEASLKRGYAKSMFPAFTQEEIELVRGTYDFFSMNHYTSRLVRMAKPGEQFRPWPLGDAKDFNAITEKHPDWPVSEAVWLYIYPEGIRHQLVWLKQQYGDIEIIITENGLSTKGGRDDQDRVQYYRDYLRQVLLAIKEDGVNVTGYTAWTIMDNFEWMDGYVTKFGLYEVDFSDPLRTRTPRASARYYADIIRRHALEGSTLQDEL